MNQKTIREVSMFAISILPYADRMIPFFRFYFFHLYNYISCILGITKVQFFLITGTLKHTNFSTTVLFIGKKTPAYTRANYFTSIMFSQVESFVNCGEFLYRQVNHSGFKSVDIIVVDANISTPHKLMEQGFLILPQVSFSLDLTASVNDLAKRLSNRRRRHIKKISDLNYSYVISRNNEKNFDFFYWKLYLPYIRKRFGEGALPRSYLNSKALYRKNGGILFVLKGNKPIAGILFCLKSKTLHALHLGVYCGDQNDTKNFASDAALFFLIKWSKTKGLKCLNYGLTAPFFSNGLFQFKKEWGMIIEEVKDNFFCALKISSLNESSLSFLHHNPCIFLDRNVMKAVVFVDHIMSKGESQELFSKYLFPKMDALIVIKYYDRKIGGVKDNAFSLNSQNMPVVLGNALQKTCSAFQKLGFNVSVISAKKESRLCK